MKAFTRWFAMFQMSSNTPPLPSQIVANLADMRGTAPEPQAMRRLEAEHVAQRKRREAAALAKRLTGEKPPTNLQEAFANFGKSPIQIMRESLEPFPRK